MSRLTSPHRVASVRRAVTSLRCVAPIRRVVTPCLYAASLRRCVASVDGVPARGVAGGGPRALVRAEQVSRAAQQAG